LAPHKEQEASLLTCSENPEIIYNLVADLSSIETSSGNYALYPQKALNIYDIYFDTKERTLDSKQYTLRIRETRIESDKNYSINMKQPSTIDSNGIEDRPEWEEKWTIDSLDRINDIFKELEKIGLKIRQLTLKDLEKTPIKVLYELNLEPIQERHTDRKVRSVAAYGKENVQLCEFDIDRVVYSFQIRGKIIRSRVYNLEIEGKLDNDSMFTVISSLATALIEKFAPHLLKWNYSKFKTGKVLERLFDEIELSELIDNRENLKCNVYELIRERIM
jgi:hypothetical protein